MSTSQGSHRAGRRAATLPVHEQPTQAAPLVIPGAGLGTGPASGPGTGPASGPGTGPASGPGGVPGGVPGQGGSRAGARRAARRRKASGSPRDGLRRLVPQALVVAFLAGGTSAFVANDKAVRLSVDGVPRTLHTFADDVDELLAHEGLTVGSHDIVAPAPGEALANGDEVVVRYGRPISLTLDGQRHTIWTTARTVEGALRQLGVRAEGAFLSVSRAAPITRQGLALDVRTERTVTFLADGRERVVRTNSATIGAALAEAGITLSGQDTASVAAGSFPRDGQTVTVLRITGSRQVREETIPYAVEKVRDPDLFAGNEVVERRASPASSLVGGAALGIGRGERLTALPVGGAFHWVFAVADGGLSTPAVYGEFDRLTEGVDVPEPTASPVLLEALRTGDTNALAGALANDLQAAALSLRPSLAATLTAGTEAGALAALVSGSGPTTAFLVKDAEAAESVATALTASGTCRTARVATSPAPGATVLPA
ncbi:ubiquitin-like domain-containing protein [Streptomyces narbonensis]